MCRRLAWAMVVVAMVLLPASASAFAVTDAAILVRQIAHNVMKRLELDAQGSNRRWLRRIARSLAIFEDLAQYRAGNVPRWRTWRQDDPSPESLALLEAFNRGVVDGQAVTGRAIDIDPEGEVPEALRPLLAALATRDSVNLAGVDQTGRIRGARRVIREIVTHLEGDVTHGGASLGSRLDVVAGGALIAARVREDRAHLAVAVVEQLILGELRDRAVEATAATARSGIGTVPINAVRGTAADLRGWRQP